MAERAGYLEGRVDVVWLSGPDRLDFLQRLSTNRTDDLSAGHGRGTVLLADDGRVVDLLACYQGADGAALVTSGPGAAAAVTAQLQRYRLYGDDVRITDASGQVRVFELFGSSDTGSSDTGELGLLLGRIMPGAEEENDASREADWRRSGEGGAERWWLRALPDISAADALLVCPSPAADALGRGLAAAGLAPTTPEEAAARRILAGVPAQGAEIGDTRANPLELGLRPLVDFGKGCYIGQEVVARLDTYDKVQRELLRLRSDHPLGAGQRIVSGAGVRARRAPGVVTSAARGSDDGWLGLGLVPRDMVDGGVLVLDDGDRGGEPGGSGELRFERFAVGERSPV